jgi:hypothetical protein
MNIEQEMMNTEVKTTLTSSFPARPVAELGCSAF